MLKEKIVEAQETYPQYDWQEAVVFITKLLERDEQAQIAFESGTNGEKGSDEKFTELFGEVAWTSDK
jgi:hypothetical protein